MKAKKDTSKNSNEDLYLDIKNAELNNLPCIIIYDEETGENIGFKEIE